MIHLPALALILSLAAGSAAAQEIAAPSGLTLTLQDVIWEPETRLVRFRFVAPALGMAEDGAATSFSQVADDFFWLCKSHGVPALARNDLDASQIVISIADRAVPFGEMDPGAIQFFEGYSVGADGTCLWEPY